MPYSMIKVWLLKKLEAISWYRTTFVNNVWRSILAKYSTIMYFKKLHENITYYISIEWYNVCSTSKLFKIVLLK